MAGIGFKVCVTVGGHGPGIVLMNNLVNERGGAIEGMRILNIHWVDLLRNSGSFRDRFRGSGLHGGIFEAAVVRYCDERFCDPARLPEVHNTNFQSQLEPLSREQLADIAENATRQLGREIFETVVDGIASAADACLKSLKRQPGPA